MPAVKERLIGSGHPLATMGQQIDPLTSVESDIRAVLVDAPPLSVRDGGVIRSGYSAEIDELRQVAGSGKEWLTFIEQRERDRTGIRSLKVGFTRVFGYYIEVSRAQLDNVPADYIRKQTLANGERFITPELKKYEETIIGAEEKLKQLEYQAFVELRGRIVQVLTTLQKTAHQVAELDVWLSMAHIAVERGYVRPEVHEGTTLLIEGGRHPVVEASVGPGVFVPNDTRFDEKQSLLLITGPNMAGKSTYMRQVALIVLMAQIGSFVPANRAIIGLADRIFTRVGASDDLASGQSTFMVEMTEVAHILHHATERSLLILDEVGRGTSTYDGMAIAWSVAEAVHRMGARALFATHYHELVQLESTLERAACYNVAIRESDDTIVFLHQIRPGGVDKSYGIQVARLAGLPSSVIRRAHEILSTLEQGKKSTASTIGDAPSAEIALTEPVVSPMMLMESAVGGEVDQLALFYPNGEPVKKSGKTAVSERLVNQLTRLDINRMTPLEALTWIAKAQKKIKQGDGSWD
ncbi:DNA mismatch repair protein MutS [Heliophilum fasciatum]|nr:DNA mismatch repair protein MutS [Heliophilum fasciatum]